MVVGNWKLKRCQDYTKEGKDKVKDEERKEEGMEEEKKITCGERGRKRERAPLHELKTVWTHLTLCW